MADYTTSKSAITTTAAATKTLLEIVAGSADRLQIVQWSVSFAGVSPTQEPILVTLCRKSAAGTGGTGETERPLDPADGTAAAAVTSIPTGEGTIGDVLESILVHPQSGVVIQYLPEDRPVAAASGILAIRYTTPSGVNPNAAASLIWKE